MPLTLEGKKLYLSPNLKHALNLLEIVEINLFDQNNDLLRHVSQEEHAAAFFNYLELAGYLNPHALEKAVTCLSRAKKFSQENQVIIDHLTQVLTTARQSGSFDVAWFLAHFCKDFFRPDDIIDLIVFLQQAAFERGGGIERDRIEIPLWLKEHSVAFKQLASTLGILNPVLPKHQVYCGTAIMGAASSRVKTRIDYFNSLKIDCGHVWALTGSRELSKGLDEEGVMAEVANAMHQPLIFVAKGDGAAQRLYLDGVTEAMMIHFLLKKMCPDKTIDVLDSIPELGHWRTTTAQNAKDIARIVIDKIQVGEINCEKNEPYRFLIITEQPYIERMTRQVQRAFNAELQARSLCTIQVTVEGVGDGVMLRHNEILKRVNSELAALMTERFHDAQLCMRKNKSVILRQPHEVFASSFLQENAASRL
jgi:hypothetical protein